MGASTNEGADNGRIMNVAEAFTLALDHQKAGRRDQAEAIHRRILAALPDHAPSLHYLGLIEAERGSLAAGLLLIARSLELAPDTAATWANLGRLLRGAGRFTEAADAYRRATRLEPGFAKAWLGLGHALRKLERLVEALAAYDRALALKPDDADISIFRGLVLERQGRLDEAAAACRSAIALQPANAGAHNNLGNALKGLGRTADAEAAYRQAIALQPDYADAHANLGYLLLLHERFAEGWPELDWRRWARQLRAASNPVKAPLWNGGRIGGTLLLRGEQGVGEEILCASLIPEAQARAPRVLLECDARLIPLFTRSLPQLDCVARAEPPDPRLLAADVAAQDLLGSLPRWLRRRVKGLLPGPPYLVADAARAAALRARYQALGPGKLVGIAWRSVNPRFGHAKALPLADWAPILATPGVTFIDLQYGDTAAERREIAQALGVNIQHDETIDQLADLDAFAAQIAALDLVVSVSNTTVHLAGALGKPSWMLLSSGPGLLWYWFLGREHSPWYASLRLFRQPAPGAWPPVIERVAAELRGWAQR